MSETFNKDIDTGATIPSASPESPEVMAQEKLDQLMKLDHFGVRFVNQDEYKAIFDNSGKIGKEAYWVGHQEKSLFGGMAGMRPLSFDQYLARGKALGWESVAADQANWDIMADYGDMPAYKKLMSTLKKIHSDFMREEGLKSHVRQEVLRGMYEKLKPLVEQRLKQISSKRQLENESCDAFRLKYGGEIANNAISTIDALLVKNVRSTNDIWDKIDLGKNVEKNVFCPDHILSDIVNSKKWLKGITPDVERILENFINDPEYLTNNKENLREIIHILAYSTFNQRNDFRYDDEHRSYHIALIIDDSVFKHSLSSRNGYWGVTDTSLFNSQNHILGAIACMPNKELVREMIEISSGSHPVFAANGTCLYPKTSKQVSGPSRPL